MIDVEKLENELTERTKILKDHHGEKKVAESELKKDRDKFFSLLDSYIEATQTLARRTIDLPKGTDPIEVARDYPGYRLIEVKGDKIIIEKDPQYLKFAWVNPQDGFVYKRNVIEKTKLLDDDALERDHPDVWERVTKPARVLDLENSTPEDIAVVQEYFVHNGFEKKLESPRKAKDEDIDADDN